MIKKTYNLQLVVYSIIFLFFAVPCFAQAEKIIKLMPKETELLWQKDDISDPLVRIRTYRFGTANTQEKVLEFYRQLFKNDGFSEMEGYSPEKKPLGPKMAYFFTKPGKLIMLNLVGGSENDQHIYYITLHEPDAKAIKNFTEQGSE